MLVIARDMQMSSSEIETWRKPTVVTLPVELVRWSASPLPGMVTIICIYLSITALYKEDVAMLFSFQSFTFVFYCSIVLFCGFPSSPALVHRVQLHQVRFLFYTGSSYPMIFSHLILVKLEQLERFWSVFILLDVWRSIKTLTVMIITIFFVVPGLLFCHFYEE